MAKIGYGARTMINLENLDSDPPIEHDEIHEVGQGAAGKVIKARCKKSGKFFAIKKISKSRLDSLDKTLLQNEINIMNQIRFSHPCITRLLGTYQDQDRVNLVLNFLEGKSFESLINENKTSLFPHSLLIDILCDVLSAMDTIHLMGYVHRDIKPANIIISQQGSDFRGILIDFGLACSSDDSIPPSEFILGTPYYMSPEQARGYEQLDGKSDIFSFGIFLYELFTGHMPFEGKTEEITIMRIMYGKYTKPVFYCVPQTLCSIIEKCLEKKKQNRYQSCEEIIRDLRAYQRNLLVV